MLGRLKPKNNYQAVGSGWGVLQLDLHYSNFDASDFKKNNPKCTGALINCTAIPSSADGILVATNKALSANWIMKPNMRIFMNLVRINCDTPIKVLVNRIP